MRLLLLLLLL